LNLQLKTNNYFGLNCSAFKKYLISIDLFTNLALSLMIDFAKIHYQFEKFVVNFHLNFIIKTNFSLEFHLFYVKSKIFQNPFLIFFINFDYFHYLIILDVHSNLKFIIISSIINFNIILIINLNFQIIANIFIILFNFKF